MPRLEERPTEAARRLLAEHGLSFQPGRRPVPAKVWHDLVADLRTDEPLSPTSG